MIARPQKFRLHPHVFAARINSTLVLLDVKNDRYFGIEIADDLSMAAHIEGWPASRTLPDEQSATTTHPDNKVDDTLLELIRANVLTRDSKSGKVYSEASAPLATTSAIDDGPSRVRIAIADILRFVVATVVGKIIVRRMTFERIVQRYARIRIKHDQRKEAQHSHCIPMLSECLEKYTRLRPFFFSMNNQCLLDCIILKEFVSGYGIFADWIFGVRNRPFSAHCWLQVGGKVLNDTPQNVLRYTTIMLV